LRWNHKNSTPPPKSSNSTISFLGKYVFKCTKHKRNVAVKKVDVKMFSFKFQGLSRNLFAKKILLIIIIIIINFRVHVQEKIIFITKNILKKISVI